MTQRPDFNAPIDIFRYLPSEKCIDSQIWIQVSFCIGFGLKRPRCLRWYSHLQSRHACRKWMRSICIRKIITKSLVQISLVTKSWIIPQLDYYIILKKERKKEYIFVTYEAYLKRQKTCKNNYNDRILILFRTNIVVNLSKLWTTFACSLSRNRGYPWDGPLNLRGLLLPTDIQMD